MGDHDHITTLEAAIKAAFLHASSEGGWRDDATLYRLAAERLGRMVVLRAEHDAIIQTHRGLLEAERRRHGRELEELKVSEGRNGEKLRALWIYLHDLAPAGGTRKTVLAEDVRRAWETFDPREKS